MNRVTIALLIFAFPTLSYGEKNATIEPRLTTPSKLIAEDTFDRDSLGDPWTTAKGDWKIVDGAMVGKELSSDNHAAVCTFNLSNDDSAVQFSFKLDGTDGFHFSLNRKGGHLFRVIVTEDRVLLSTDKNKKDPNSKSERLDSASASFHQGQWYTMLVEMKGDQVSVTADDGLRLDGRNPSLATTKPGYRFVMRDDSLVLDDLRIWEVGE